MSSIEEQERRVLENFRRKPSDLEKYIFPGLGLGVLVSGARRVTDEMFHAAAGALAGELEDASLRQGSLYPPLTRIREVSAAIATEVVRVARVPPGPSRGARLLQDGEEDSLSSRRSAGSPTDRRPGDATAPRIVEKDGGRDAGRDGGRRGGSRTILVDGG